MKIKRLVITDRLLCDMLEARLRDGHTFQDCLDRRVVVEYGIPEDGKVSFKCIGEGQFEFVVQSEGFPECEPGELLKSLCPVVRVAGA